MALFIFAKLLHRFGWCKYSFAKDNLFQSMPLYLSINYIILSRFKVLAGISLKKGLHSKRTHLLTPQLLKYLQVGQHHKTQWSQIRYQEETGMIHFGEKISCKGKKTAHK